MDENPGRLDADLNALLDAERRYPEAPDAVRARVLAHVERTIALGAGAAPAAGSLAAVLLARPVVAVLAAMAVGGLAGSGVYRLVAKDMEPGRPVVAPHVEPAVPAPSVAAADPPAVTPAPPAAPPPPVPSLAVRSPAPRATKKTTPAGDELEAERIVLQDARARIAAGDGLAALAEIAQHAQRFPKGALSEEREALAIKALILAASPDAARARAASFRRQYPQSIYLPAVDEAVDSIR